jgi:uncharacterized protein YyaL (SSP411 family)
MNTARVCRSVAPIIVGIVGVVGVACAALALACDVHAQERATTPKKPVPTADELKKLPADGRPDYNRLVFEQSPYLLQHATNPVDWFPWGDAAFAKARAEDKPVFLSIGYSTCHWCHVMEHESFEDPEVAAILNASFVAIKVDREERPDVDQVYMQVTQAITGSGGWPMTVILTPDKKPFFAGTYFPKHGVHGGAGLVDILKYVADAWKTQRDMVVREGDKVVAAIRARAAQSEAGELDAKTLERAYRELAETFDARNGGFGTAPKFPIGHELVFLMRYGSRTGDAHAIQMAESTLQAMAHGGIRDHVGYGFHRYSTDASWLVPHFEKMLYDQALIANAYVEAFELTRKAQYADVARETFEYVLRAMRSPSGGFYSAEDADSDGEEGRFYTWTRVELEAALGKEDGELAAEVYELSAPSETMGSGAMPSDARQVLRLSRELDAIAERHKMDVTALAKHIEELRRKLFDVREKRVHPLKDDKILTDWNGLMIGALAHGARALGEPRYAETAQRAADLVLAKLRDEHGRLLKRMRGDDAGLPAAVDDYAFVIHGLIELYETDFDARRLEQAIALERTFTADFWDAKEGGYFFAPTTSDAWSDRGKDAYDGALPSGNSVAAVDLLSLARLTGDASYAERAERIFKAFAKLVERRPSAFTQMMIALELASSPPLDVVIAGRADASDTAAMLASLRARWLPNAFVLLRPDGDDPAIARIAPFTKDQKSDGGRARAYVCRNFACERPIDDVAAFGRALDSIAKPASSPTKVPAPPKPKEKP